MTELHDIENIGHLIAKYFLNELSDTERAELHQWQQSSTANKQKFEELTGTDQLVEKMRAWKEAGAGEEEVWRRIESCLYPKPRKFYQLNWFRIAAAIILVTGSIAIWFTVSKNRSKKELPLVKTGTNPANDVSPGGFKAKLTLADGSTIVLDSVMNGKLSEQGSTDIINKGGHLVYASTKEDALKSKVVYNILSTSNGETYMLTLSDGSKVWLNAASSIRYPVVFNDKDRRVEINGEAYFEVAHDAAKPFLVNIPSSREGTAGATIKVLGTHFNVNAYGDEALVKTTLLEGKVNVTVTGGRTPTILQPGQQARVDAAGNIKMATTVDLEEVMAWKNGKFVFNDTNIQMVMRQLERWYDVQVSYSYDISKQPINLNGQISRFSNASKVLDMLAATGWLHFKIEGKKITVMK